MSIKSILCAYSGDAARGSGLRHAIKLTKHHRAHLTGVLRHNLPTIERRYGQRLPASLIEQLHANDRARIDDVKGRFAEMTAAGEIEGQAEFVELDPPVHGRLSEYARAFDLVVTGAHSDLSDEDHLSAHPDLIALHSGRPVLVVPNGYEAEGLAERALVAWDGKRASARAIGDAMDILAEKVGVTLFTVGETPKGTDQLIANLQRHGVAVDARHEMRAGSIAQTILSAANDAEAKLIVMGAFEHSKFSHDVFGGVTTDVIAKAKVPVFMAH